MSEQARPPPFRLSSNQDEAPRSKSALPLLANIPNKPLCPEPSLSPTTSPTLPRKCNRSSSPPRSSQRPRITLTPNTPSIIVETELCTDSIRALSQQIETLSQKLAREQTAITEALASLHAENAASPAVIQAIEAEMSTKTPAGWPVSQSS
ncbi:hypothetical protein IFR05_014830 [Cadophora sp. M221]|nr:hypothetical protein IFR05_014830 [Cadophora sp. M221]